MTIRYRSLHSVILDEEDVLKPIETRVFGRCFAESLAEYHIQGSAARMLIACGGYIEDLWDEVESDPLGALVISHPGREGGADRLTVHTGPIQSALQLALAPADPDTDDDGMMSLWYGTRQERITWDFGARALALLPPAWAQEPAHLAHLGFWLRSVLGIGAGGEMEQDVAGEELLDTAATLRPLLAEWGHILQTDDALFRFPCSDPDLVEHRLSRFRLPTPEPARM